MENIDLLAEHAVREAGKLLLETIKQEDIIEKSGTANFVTHVDLAVEKFIVKRLQQILPESNIITEEAEENQFSFTKPTWILDPVDGTTNLMYGYRHSAISLALIVDGCPFMGIIYNPYMDEMFTAQKDKGALLNGEPVHVSETKQISDCVTAFGTTPYDRSTAEKTFAITKNVFMKCRDVRRSGCAALDLCYIACGRSDGFFELRLQPWDFAAGIVILKEAGGEITNWEGTALTCLKPDSVLATNGCIHSELLDFMR